MKGKLMSSEIITQLLNNAGVLNWEQATQYVAQLPYGRNANRQDFTLVLKELKGTCSSKHALLAKVASENHFSNIKLMLGIYKMNLQNTPGIGTSIEDIGLSYIPEAHCYLSVDGVRLDYTTPTSSIQRIEKDILLETEIAPNQVTVWKVDFHKKFIKNWLISEAITYSFDTVWSTREQCIATLTSS